MSTGIETFRTTCNSACISSCTKYCIFSVESKCCFFQLEIHFRKEVEVTGVVKGELVII